MKQRVNTILLVVALHLLANGFDAHLILRPAQGVKILLGHTTEL